uniref:Uncharacterized protein n=1 Tax=Siphoviridae sp. cthu813 TaxID=2825618 RepID=A0A8S5VIN3_9CAUD|nr:MAG TPA: hypothetical protein [Siphoviridae sp. cthu813]
MSCVANPCKICKNIEFCKFALTSCEALDGLRIGDGSGPFTISVDCKYRAATYVRSSNDLLNRAIAANKNPAPDISYKEGEST